MRRVTKRRDHIAAGFQRTKSEVVRVVHIGVSTLATRLREFSGTGAGVLTHAQLKVRRPGGEKEAKERLEGQARKGAMGWDGMMVDGAE